MLWWFMFSRSCPKKRAARAGKSETMLCYAKLQKQLPGAEEGVEGQAAAIKIDGGARIKNPACLPELWANRTQKAREESN